MAKGTNGGGGSGYTSGDERSSSNGGSPRGPVRAAPKRRHSTYVARREEIVKLNEEVVGLERARDELELKRPRPSPELAAFLMQHPQWAAATAKREIAFAGVQSMLTAYSNVRNPLDTFISLPADPELRRQQIHALRETKLNDAAKHLLERRRFLDLEHPHQQSEQSTKDGDFVVACFDLTVFRDVASVREVYEAVAHCIENMELTMSERLGAITIRESDEDDATTSHTRFVATIDGELESEWNSVSFAGFFGPSALYHGEYGVLTTDYVDEDALYPYQPQRRIRSDSSAAVLVTACPRQYDEDDGIAVTMARCSFSRRHRPKFPIPQRLSQRLEDGADRWCDLMLKVIKERVAW